ncbi:MAG: hypothetical protein HZB25_03500 [Candidatus Eisenbacteria bacterium]|nr:hypothetical protein [Candidatus Eisenbacteria bacterium]
MTHSPPGRAPRGLAIFAAVLWAGLVLGAARAGAESRLLSADTRGATVEFLLRGLRVDTVQVEGRAYSRIRFDGGGLADLPGLPELPSETAALGIPRGGSARLTLLSVQASERPALPPQPVVGRRLQENGTDIPTNIAERRPDARAYARAGLWPRETAGLGPDAMLRYQRVQPLGVRPVRYDAARGVLWVAERILVRVDFEDAGAPPQDRAALPAGGALPVVESASQEGMYRNTLLNYDQARAFRLQRPALPPPAPAFDAALPAAGFPDFKLRVDTTGVYAVPFAQLQRKYPELAAVPVGDLRCYEQLPGPFPKSAGLADPTQYPQEVPIRVVDVDGNGSFDGDDYVVFFGRELSDRFRAKWYDILRTSRYYTRGHVYWLARRAAGGPAAARMAERPASLGLASTTTPESYRATVHREEHFFFVPDPDFLDQPTFMLTNKLMEDTLAFQASEIDSSRRIGLRAAFRGADLFNEGVSLGTHMISMWLERPQGTGKLSDPVVSRFTFVARDYALYDSDRDPGFTLDGTRLSPVRNVLRLVGEHPAGGGFAPNSGAYMEWFEVNYYRRFLAPGTTGRFGFTSGDAPGALTLRPGKFRENTVEVYDVSDSAAPVFIDAAPTAQRTGSTWQVSFQDTVGAMPHAYVAASRSFLPQLPDGVVIPDTPSALGSITGADLVIVTHEGLESEAQRLANLHQAEGLRVAVARVGDVYDEFDGGRKSDVAIKRMLRRAFYRWSPAPRYVLLLGESSENPMFHRLSAAAGIPPTFQSHRDLLPSPRGFGSVPLGSHWEVIPEDHWYVAGLDTTDRVPVFPGMAIGRIPAHTAADLAPVVDKIVQYGRVQPADAWRGRMLLVADDQWSNGIGFADNVLTRNDWEITFRQVNQQMQRVTAFDGGFRGFGVDSFYLSLYTDTLHSCDVSGNVAQRDYNCITTTRDWHALIGPKLWQKMGQGHLMVDYQGHANSRLWAHERILEGDGSNQDAEQIGNQDRPFFLMAFACHVNRYDFYRENDGFYGESNAERLLGKARSGTIGSFASTGYEWLPYGGEPDLGTEVVRSMFVRPPTPDVGGDRGVKWILGDLLRDAKSNFLLRLMGAPRDTDSSFVAWRGFESKPPLMGGNLNAYEVFSYCLLGDPALRMDPGTAFFTLSQDGRPMDTFQYFRTTGPDSVTLSALVESPVGLDSAWVQERLPDGAVRAVPAGSYSVTREGDPAATHARRFRISFRTVPHFEDYFVDFRARNVDGVESYSPVRRVLEFTTFTSDKGPLDPAHALPADQRIQVGFATSVGADSSLFRFRLNGHTLEPTSVTRAADPPEQGGLERWTATLRQTFPGGLNELAFVVGGPGGATAETRVSFRVVAGEALALSEVINYPNPFAAATGFHYALSRAVDDLSVRIYTLSGRLIREIRVAAGSGADAALLDAGTHMLAWDGRDGDGDPLANGVYLFKLTVRSGAQSLDQLGRMVKVE